MVSFPRQITSRTYLRDRDLLRQRDEADFLLFDEEEEDEEHEPAAAEADDEESADREHDAEQFLEESRSALEEDESTM